MRAATLDSIVEESLPLDSHDSDEELMLQYIRGEGKAFEILFHRHKKRVYSFIRRYLGWSCPVEDLFQEVFLRIVRARRTYRPTAKFTTWLFAITRSVCIDAMRKESRSPLSDHLADPAPVNHAHAVQETQREHAFQAEVTEKLERLILGLPAEQREVLLMRERLNLSFKEIAQITGSTTGTVKSRMRYALQALRKGLVAEGIVQ